jgi:hypothetical protein
MSGQVRRLRLVALGIAFLTGLVLTGGCGGSTAKVEGTVQYKGQPVDGAMVQLVRDDGIVVATGTTDQAGKFKLVTPQGKDAVPAGTYKATVSKRSLPAGMDPAALAPGEGRASGKDYKDMMMKMKNAKDLLPAQFASNATTTLQVTVPPSGNVVLDLGS